MLYNKVLKYLTLSSFSTLLVKKKSRKIAKFNDWNKQESYSINPPLLIKRINLVWDYCEIIQNSWWRNFAVFVVAPIHNELWRRVLVHRLYQQMHEIKYIVTYINLIMCLIVLPRNITTPVPLLPKYFDKCIVHSKY